MLPLRRYFILLLRSAQRTNSSCTEKNFDILPAKSNSFNFSCTEFHKSLRIRYVILPEMAGRVFLFELCAFFTFFYIRRRKYRFRANFQFPVFDGFTRFGVS